MRPKLPAWVILGLGLLGPGCSVLVEGTRVTHARFSQAVGDYKEMTRIRRWAEEAYFRYQSGHLGEPCSKDFACGFKEGFSEFLYRGTCEPPYLVPQCYRSPGYRTPEGYRAIEDWFAGYRAGVSAADEGGYRQWIIGPTPGPGMEGAGGFHPPHEDHPPDGRLMPPLPPIRTDPGRGAPSTDTQELPPPRVLPPDKDAAPQRTPTPKEQPSADDRFGNTRSEKQMPGAD
jgi:hypothetical protein